MKILIVDDSTAMRRIVRRALQKAGLKENDVIVEAENGAIGLEKVTCDPPDLILSDWNMPEMSGIDFLVALRQRGFAAPFGFVTSEGTDAMRLQARETSASFFLTKPFSPEELAAVVKEYLT